MSVEKNKELIRREVDAWNNKDLAAFDELYAPTYVHSDPAQPEIRDLDGMKMFAQTMWETYPDFHATLDSLVGDDDLVVKRYTLTGTHQGSMAGEPATGNSIKLTGMTMFRVKDGKIVESWWNYDMMSILQQLGLAPANA